MNKEIARQLETSIRNVEKYVSRLFIKTGTSSRTELVRYALENHLVKWTIKFFRIQLVLKNKKELDLISF